MSAKFLKFLFIAVGVLSLIVGIVGIAVPLLPTTPFLLLSAFCFARSSEKFHSWLIHHPKLGPPIRDWQERGVIRRGPKIFATAMLVPGCALIYRNENIPLIGKVSFSISVALILLFLWTRRSH